MAPPLVGRERRAGGTGPVRTAGPRPYRRAGSPSRRRGRWRSGRGAEAHFGEALPDELAQVLPGGVVTGVALQAPGPPLTDGTHGPRVTLGSLGPTRPRGALAAVGTGESVSTGLAVPAVPARRAFGAFGSLGPVRARRAAGTFGACRTLDPPRPLRTGRPLRPGRPGRTRASGPARGPGGTGGAGAPRTSGRSLGTGGPLRTGRTRGPARLFRRVVRWGDASLARRGSGVAFGRMGGLCGGGRGLRRLRCDHGVSRMGSPHTLGPGRPSRGRSALPPVRATFRQMAEERPSSCACSFGWPNRCRLRTMGIAFLAHHGYSHLLVRQPAPGYSVKVIFRLIPGRNFFAASPSTGKRGPVRKSILSWRTCVMSYGMSGARPCGRSESVGVAVAAGRRRPPADGGAGQVGYGRTSAVGRACDGRGGASGRGPPGAPRSRVRRPRSECFGYFRCTSVPFRSDSVPREELSDPYAMAITRSYCRSMGRLFCRGPVPISGTPPACEKVQAPAPCLQ